MGQVQTIDRVYGFGIDTLLHHITDGINFSLLIFMLKENGKKANELLVDIVVSYKNTCF